jgi:GNAT superfamily N-acetyltransferase
MPVIRRATPRDAGVLADLNRHVQDWHAATYPDVFKTTTDPVAVTEWFADVLRDPDCAAFIAGDPAQGYVTCTLLVRPENPFAHAARRMMIDQIGVAPLARRQGVGQALIKAAMDHARDMGCGEIMLDTWALNHEAHAFFRAQGLAPRRMLFHRHLPSLAP